MYSIKPWGKAAIIGNTVGGLVLGVGMRWRETVVDVIEKGPSPTIEHNLHRRCVLSQSSLRVLADVGVTEDALQRSGRLRPAGRWVFATENLDTIRSGDTYPGCAPAEAAFHISYGALVRVLRQQFTRFGGNTFWGTTAGPPAAATDSSGFWLLGKEYGALNELECVVGASASHGHCAAALFGADELARRPTAKYSVDTGVCPWAHVPEPLRQHLFAPARGGLVGDGSDVDFAVVLGRGVAIHFFKTEALNLPPLQQLHAPTDNYVKHDAVEVGLTAEMAGSTSMQHVARNDYVHKRADHLVLSWRAVSLVTPNSEADKRAAGELMDAATPNFTAASMALKLSTMHPAVREVMRRSKNVAHDVVSLPLASCPLLPDAQGSRVTVLKNALLPVDPFEWRGDAALVALEDSASLVRRLYKQKYYRGFVPVDLREHEMDTIAKRTQLLQRDLRDAETFLNAFIEIPSNKAEAPTIAASSSAQ